MIKYVSITSLLSSFLFVVTTFTASKFQSFSQNIIGYPFAFFSAESDKIIDASKKFSGINLAADFIVCIMASMLIIKICSLGFRPVKVPVKK
ncbi:MAG: hypothetical protein JST94_00220 [Bacteroidetes bacterium]|nr:hypothetical protein [Bacteroidota bacterium]MBS1592300.1 hypothetical protein [Bacteroidota bacterium]MBS1640046.1 hypothetical protein [Bacteroidota bacterium]MBS1640991.1 hypothetical protein [Bacteroidota bacterium]MBS1669876.1 hypothetical protein [Bacteroidota bacterium]